MTAAEGGRRTPPKLPRPTPAPIAESEAIERLGADPPPAAVERFWATVAARTPLLETAAEGKRTVTFLWRDAEAEEVLLFANRITDERDLGASLMRRLPGTDVWHLSYRMRDDWRASYGFVRRMPGEAWPWSAGDQLAIRRGLDRALPDPRNPRECRNRPGVPLSVVELPDAPPQPWLEPPADAVRGEVSEHLLPGGRRLWVYAPPGGLEAGLPVCVLLDGEVWTSTQDAAGTVDALIADGMIRRCALLMPESGGRDRRWRDLDADGEGARWIVEELLPWAAPRFGFSRAPADTVVAGQSLGGYTALRAAVEHPEAVGGALAQSASLWQRELGDVLERSSGGEALRRSRFFVEVGAQEWVLQPPNASFAAALKRTGAEVHYREFNGGHDYACWRGGFADGLIRLFPAEPRETETAPSFCVR